MPPRPQRRRRSEPDAALPLTADVSRSDEVSRAVDAAVAHFNGLDVLVNNAGIHFARALDEYTDEEWQRDLRGQRQRRVLYDARGAAGAAPLARSDRDVSSMTALVGQDRRRRLRGLERRAGVDDQGAGAGAGAPTASASTASAPPASTRR